MQWLSVVNLCQIFPGKFLREIPVLLSNASLLHASKISLFQVSNTSRAYPVTLVFAIQYVVG